MDASKLKPGFYWVNFKGTWQIGKRGGTQWFVGGSAMSDKDILEFDPIEIDRNFPERKVINDLIKQNNISIEVIQQLVSIGNVLSKHMDPHIRDKFVTISALSGNLKPFEQC